MSAKGVVDEEFQPLRIFGRLLRFFAPKNDRRIVHQIFKVYGILAHRYRRDV